MFEKLFHPSGKKYPRKISCTASVLFEVLDESVAEGLAADILFRYREEKHALGVYADFADLTKNPVWYFDKTEYSTREELETGAAIDGILLKNLPDRIEIYEVTGCYPETSAILRRLMDQEL